MEFKNINKQLKQNFDNITKDVNNLFEIRVDKDEFWNLYLDSFPKGVNQIYRKRREYDCSCCRHFIRDIGNVVVIKNGEITTLWDCDVDNKDFQPVFKAMSDYLRSKEVTDIFVSKISKIGTPTNREMLPTGEVIKYNHFALELPIKFVNNISYETVESIKGKYRDAKNVFKRSLDEITEDSIETVLELIKSNTLYRGGEWENSLCKLLDCIKEYKKIDSDKQKDLYTWENSGKVGTAISKIRNHSIGTLLVNLSEGMDLETAVKKYEYIVAPSNYKRPKAIFTKRMLEDAKKTIEDMGYINSLGRRFANLDDISINNVLYANKNAANRMTGVADVFEEMSKEVAINPKKFDKVESINIGDFIENILPNTESLEIFLENRFSPNFVSLIAPENKEAKTMFKWNNNFAWAYSGNVTDSLMKERVKMAGGKVDGVLRFSIQWNDKDAWDQDDLDAHCVEPNGHRIYYGDMIDKKTSGNLDVDVRYPKRGQPAVENIAWSDKSKMLPGTYLFEVNQYCYRGGTQGFRAEIEFDGQVFEFDYPTKVTGTVKVATVILDNAGNFSIHPLLTTNSKVSSKKIWNLHTNQFVPVSVMCYSPNYWDEQRGIGHLHYLFMLKGCVNSEKPNGFFNEFLKEDLMAHRKVLEALGSKMSVKDVEDQLSGIGFSSTKRNNVIVKVNNGTEKVIRVEF